MQKKTATQNHRVAIDALKELGRSGGCKLSVASFFYFEGW
jgi:hypothetical protein